MTNKEMINELRERHFAYVEALEKENKELKEQIPKHGEWKQTLRNLYSCSVCGNWVLTDRITGYFYCPSCGAKMGVQE